MTQQRFEIDGNPVVACEGVFSGAFDMDAADAEEVVYDETYVLVVVGRTIAPAFRTDKNGDLVRRNRFAIDAGKVAKGSLGDELAEMFDLDIQQKLPFTPPPGPVPAGQGPAGPVSVSVPPAAPQKPVAASPTAGVVSGAPAPATVPHGVPVGQVPVTEDEALRRYLEGE
jgi:hypothetical protein